MVRGDGARVWDDTGRSYIDALASLWYCHVGHGRPEIASAVADQLSSLDAFHCFEMFTNQPAEQFTERIAAMAPMPDARVFLTSSGSEAVDTAMKLVRLVASLRGEPERHLLVARDQAYHGVTYGGMTAQGLAPNREHFGPYVPEVHHVHHLDLDDVRALFEREGSRIAAVFAEPVQGAGGVWVPDRDYLADLRRLCDDHGALLVFDEVICGFGRLGTWWGADHFGVEPDLVTFAKGATSGYQPLGGVIVGRAVREVLEADDSFVLRHGFTYSGHPAACAAGVANLDLLEGEDLPERALHIGDVLGPGLQGLADDGLVPEVRGVAGIWGVSMPDGVDAADVRTRMVAEGVIPRPIMGHTIAFCPPLIISDDDLATCVDVLAAAVAAEL
jgi:adenosylmethionine-8-amino-7-oxononanoate aminotransferase